MFKRITDPLHHQPDVCAFLLLETLVQQSGGIISSADNGQVWLSTPLDALDKVATPEEILTLYRCGVTHDTERDGLTMLI